MSVIVRESSVAARQQLRMWPVLLSVWATFFLYSAVAAPVPGVNEPHYLCKSRHFWQPDWCDSDFFLASPNAHTVFYATIGGLTRFMSFELAAWIGRFVTCGLLSWGWTTCFSQLFLTRWSPLWSAWLYLGFAACGNFSGEWLVGGVEGKVLSYGFLLAAFGDVLRHRSMCAATWAGLAVSFHPVVGIWGVLAFVLSHLINQLVGWKDRSVQVADSPYDRDSHRGESISEDGTRDRRNYLFGFALSLMFVLLALPGLIPVFQILTESVSHETRYAATYLQVYFRLAHHLDPMLFSSTSYYCYAVMLVIWGCGTRWGGRTNSKQRFDQIVFWSVVFAVAGILLGWGPRPPKLMPFFAERAQLLKFYPFRLADLLVPVALSVSLIGVLERSLFMTRCRSSFRSRFVCPEWFLFIVFLAAVWRSHTMTETNRYSLADRGDWLDVCEWIDQNLPPDALVQSPTNGWAFKWFAKRAEYVSFKDCPQDAAGIVEWNRRLNFLQKWFEQKYSDEYYSSTEMKEFRELTGISHLLTDRIGPLELEPVYRNGTFQVYDLRGLD